MNTSHMSRLYGRGSKVADVLEAEKPRIGEAGLPRIKTATQKTDRHCRSSRE
jgi:hypothetical protein